MLPVVDAVSAASPPTYTSILALDSQIRDFDVPIPLRMMDQDGDAPHPLALHQAMIACNREVGKYYSSQSLSSPPDPHTGWIRNPLTKKETLTYMFLSSLPFFLPFCSAPTVAPKLLHASTQRVRRLYIQTQICSFRSRDFYELV